MVHWRGMSGRDFWIGLLVLPLLFGCQSKPQAAAPDIEQARQEQARQQEQKRADDWQRMKECAQQTERMAKQEGWVQGKDGILGWQNHYSPKYGRCFVSMSFMDESAKKDPDWPLLYDELIDAFEGRTLAMCTDAQVSKARFLCNVQDPAGPTGDCGACRQWIEDRMRH